MSRKSTKRKTDASHKPRKKGNPTSEESSRALRKQGSVQRQRRRRKKQTQREEVGQEGIGRPKIR
jgi:hypothetical protein